MFMPLGPKNLTISFSAERLTHYGGIFLLFLFFKKIRLKSLIYYNIQLWQRNNKFTLSEEFLAIIYPIILGLGRIETSHLLRSNGVFQYLTGLPAYPDPTTLRRFLLRIAPIALPKLRNLIDKMIKRFSSLPKQPTSVIFDLDSTVLTLYGKQELARIGYNPNKPGRVSYHPLLCFNGLTKDFWHGELRPGDTHTASGAIDLLEVSFAKLPESVKSVKIRADKGFFDHKIIEAIEFHKAKFIIVAKTTQPVKRKLPSLRYQKHTSGTESSEFYYQPHGWQKKYRFIAIRRPLPEEQTNQLSLFTVGRYSYQVFVTNMVQTPLYCWKFYNKRAAVELIIKELKRDYPLAKIPTKHFHANEAYFHILLFSYNLLNWFKRLCLPKDFHHLNLNTLRYRLLLIPGEFVRSGNKPILKLPANFQYKRAFEVALKNIDKLKV
jgi:hypothetical protein